MTSSNPGPIGESDFMRGERILRSPSRTGGPVGSRTGGPVGHVAGTVAKFVAVVLVVSVAVGGAGHDASGRREGRTAQPVAAVEKARADEEPRLKVPENYFLEPADEPVNRREWNSYLLDRIEIEGLDRYAEHKGRYGRLTLDAGDLSGKAVFKKDKLNDCKGHGTAKLDCPVDDAEPVFGSYLRALGSSRNGQRGTLRYTFTPEKGEPLTATTEVVVGRPVLAARQLPMRKRVKPTETVPVPLTFKNVGEVPAHGVIASVRPGRTSGKQHRNCRYTAQSMTCRFPDVVVRPGETRTLRPVTQVRSPSGGMYEPVSYTVLPLERVDGGQEEGEPGQDSPLRVVDAPGAKGPFRATHDFGDELLMYVQRDTRADYEAVGIRLTKKSADRLRVRVRVGNKGPSTDPGPGSLYHAKVTFPPGSTVLRPPRDEDREEDQEVCQKLSSREYSCPVSPDTGQTEILDFVVSPGWWGKTEVKIGDSERFPRRDPDPGNDTASVTTPMGPVHIALSGVLLLAFAAALAVTRRRWTGPLRRLAGRVRHRA